MTTHQALLLTSNNTPLTLKTLPKPTATPGSAIIRILSVTVIPYMHEILTGTRPYPLSFPLIPGGSAIGRIDSVGPDSISLLPGQLVFCDPTIRARDDADANILLGIFGGVDVSTRKLMEGEWRHGTWAEYAKFPLENLYPMNEHVLCGELGYKVEELSTLLVCAVPFGGLSGIGVRPGQSVVVAPATGYYGGAAVAVALSLGCVVIAAGRNVERLESLKGVFGGEGTRLRTVALTGDADADAKNLRIASGNSKGADAYIDFSPPAASTSTHFRSCLAALKSGGKAVFMGGIQGNISLPYSLIMFRNLSIHGKFMFTREDAERLISMAESGVMRLGKSIGMERFDTFGLQDWGDAVKAAAEMNGWGSQILLCP